MSTEPPASAIYEIEGAGFRIGGRDILQPVEMKLQPARIYGLVGANGSGKSTLVKLLARQQPPSVGRVTLLGRPLEDYGDREFARAVAYMPQFTPPAEGMTVRELVMLGRFPWRGALGRYTEEDRQKVAAALEQSDLQAFADRLVDSLSGGERQRAWLAMMLAQDTRCLLLDEPTSALDIAHQVEILALLSTLSRSRNACIVVVLHDINMAARYCDEIFALGGAGKLVASGAARELVAPDVLDRIYGLPMGVLSHPQTGAPITYVL